MRLGEESTITVEIYIRERTRTKFLRGVEEGVRERLSQSRSRGRMGVGVGSGAAFTTNTVPGLKGGVVRSCEVM